MNIRPPAWLALMIGFCLGNAAMWWYGHRGSGVSTQQLVSDARQALRNADYARAEMLSSRALALGSKSTAALLVAGDAAAKLNRLEDAVAFYARVPDTGNNVAFKALSARADTLFHLGRISESEAAFRRTLEIDSHNELINRRFAALLDSTGRRWESRRYILELVRIGRFSIEELCFLADFERPIDVASRVDQALKAVPDDPLPLLATARLRIRDSEPMEATELLWKVVRSRPGNLDAQGLLGDLLVNFRSRPEYRKWQEQLPREADQHPGVWSARGGWCEQNGQFESAVRCYWEAVRIEPDHTRANRQIAMAFKSLGRPNHGEPFLDRATLLDELNREVALAHAEGFASEHVPIIARLTEELGRFWEAWAWNVALAHRESEEAAAARDRLKRILDKENPPQTLNKFNPALQVDLSHFPLPD